MESPAVDCRMRDRIVKFSPLDRAEGAARCFARTARACTLELVALYTALGNHGDDAANGAFRGGNFQPRARPYARGFALASRET
jgi:hypothetical protein